MYKHGLTMVEILAVMLIISVVSSVALPAIDNFRSSDRCKAEASKFVDSIRQAKYQAMQENCLNRIVFSPDGDSYKLQRYEQDIDNVSNVIAGGNSYTDDRWESIADEEEIDFDSSVDVDLSQFSSTKTMFFKPDGYLYCYNGSSTKPVDFLTEKIITFKYGSAKIEVRLNSLGVISSEAFSNENEEDSGNTENTENPENPPNITAGGNFQIIESSSSPKEGETPTVIPKPKPQTN